MVELEDLMIGGHDAEVVPVGVALGVPPAVLQMPRADDFDPVAPTTPGKRGGDWPSSRIVPAPCLSCPSDRDLDGIAVPPRHTLATISALCTAAMTPENVCSTA